MSGRLVLLSTSHRVAPGLLTNSAWQALSDADQIAAASHSALRGVLVDAGYEVGSPPLDAPSDRARWLLEQTKHMTVVWVMGDDGDVALVEALAPLIASAADEGVAPELEIVQGSFDLPGARLLDLVAVMDRLRARGGCPWDAEQTHSSLAKYLLEETYEVLGAIDDDDQDGLREELGDVLLQVVFHARIAEEHHDRPWSIDDVAAGIVEKLVRRHPHVFADGTAETAADVNASWEDLKQAEGRTSVADGVPMAMPALALAGTLIDRAVRARLDIEVEEPDLPDELTGEQLGAILFGLVSSARRLELDPEAELRKTARTFATNLPTPPLSPRTTRSPTLGEETPYPSVE